jgi:transcription elongation factor Elf1
MAIHQYGDDDDEGASRSKGRRGITEFDCPSCNAHNPVGEPLVAGEEVLCNYCGTSFEVRASAEGKLKLREV